MNYRHVHLSIDYDTAYKACVLEGPEGYVKRFATGDPVVDFANMIDHARELSRQPSVRVMTSSSFEGFIYDTEEGQKYRFDQDDMLVEDDRPL